jgi:copper chaperone CopZ
MSKENGKAKEEEIVPGIEPTNGADVVAAESAAPQTPEEIAQAEATLRQKLEEKSFAKSDPRAAMWARRAEQSVEERNEAIAGDSVQTAMLDTLAGAQPDDAPADEVATELEETPPPAPVASAPEKVKIVVDGQEREVSRDDVIKAGVATLQKQSAADQRLQDAATYEARVRAWAQSEHERLKQVAATAVQASPPLPATGAQAPADVQAEVNKALGLLVDGQQEDAAKQLTEVLSRLAKQAAPATVGPAALANGAESQVTVTPPPVRRSREELSLANTVFNTEYANLDDNAFKFTQALVQAGLRDPANAFRPITDIVREAGNRAREVFAGTAAPAPVQSPAAPAPTAPSPGQQALGVRRELKARIPLSPTGASARAPISDGTPQVPSNRDYVKQLQRRNGSNSAPR